MSKLDELIAELCPNGVGYKKIKDVYVRLKGTSITAGKMKEIENPEGNIRILLEEELELMRWKILFLMAQKRNKSL